MHRINLRGPWQCISTDYNDREVIRCSRSFHRPTGVNPEQRVLLFIAHFQLPQRVLLNEGELKLDSFPDDISVPNIPERSPESPINVGRIEIASIMEGYNRLSIDWFAGHGTESAKDKVIRLPNVDPQCPLNDVWLMIVDP